MSVSCRKQSKIPREDSPFVMQNYDSQQDEYGKVKLTPCDPVKFSIADDFSITSNLKYRNPQKSPVRISSDPVDMDNVISKLI